MHIQTDRKALLARINRLLGQINAIKETVEKGQDKDCYAVLQQMAAARGALNGLAQLYLEGHVRDHVAGAPNAKARHRGAQELIQTLKSFLR